MSERDSIRTLAAAEAQPQLAPAPQEWSRGLRLLTKAARVLAARGAGFAVRRALWRLEYEKFQRTRMRAARDQNGSPTVRFLGGELELHPSKLGLGEELRLFGTHEPLCTRYYLQELSAGDHVLDIGSNVGYFLLLAGRAVGPSGRLLGFEPAPSVFSILQRNLARFSHANAQVFPWAIGAQTGSAQFYSSEVPNWGGLIQNKRLLQTAPTEVEVKRLDDLLTEFPDLCPKMLRMDLEGGELMVLEGAEKTLARFKPSLFIEFHPDLVGWDRVRAALVKLDRMGYLSGVLVHRTWDQPWIRKWIRERRCWSGSLPSLMRKIDRTGPELSDSTLTLILRARP